VEATTIPDALILLTHRDDAQQGGGGIVAPLRQRIDRVGAAHLDGG
jgi:hypothetical protein